jgi:NAD(P)-dependent dehydrogenase (short-subunit alcohol dehydrogenase family)
MRLKDKSVLVTGAARGAGRAIAYQAASEGAQVTAVDVDAKGLATLTDQAGAARLSVQAVVADISTAEGNALAVRQAESRFGSLTTFVANAAIIHFFDSVATTEDVWDSIQRVNLKGAHLGVQAAIPALRRAGGGGIIMLASVLGVVGDPLLPAYGAMKGGLRAMCRSIAVAYGHENIRCNTICPGDIETDMMKAQLALETDPTEARERMLSHYPLRRFASPSDVANVAIFLASDDASYITGTDIFVDGGLLSKCY